jgi:predicted RNase H-like HicB family nuclease
MRNLKIVIEKHPDGFVAYPLGLRGVVVGQGGTYDEAFADVQSAIRFHIDTFGSEALEDEATSVEDVFVADAMVDL